jgi:DNA invertase Pin-like site-specific DNA recombinase
MLSMMGAFAEFERSLIRERQREGIELAKAEGRMKGRPTSLTPKQVTTIKDRAQKGESKVALAAEFNVTRTTIYSALKA